MSLNDTPLHVQIRQVIIDDSPMIKCQYEDGETGNVLISHMTDDMKGVYITFMEKKGTDLATAKRIWEEDNARKARTPPSFDDRVFEGIDYRTRMSECYNFLVDLPLKTLFEFTEFLDSIMSTSLRFAIFAIRAVFADSFEALNAIEQFREEQTIPSVLHKHERLFHEWLVNSRRSRSDRILKEPYPFRFTDSIWVLIKTQLFSYALVTNRGCKFLQTGNMALLSRMDTGSELEKRVASVRQKYVTRLELVDEGKVTPLSEMFVEFNLMNCRMTYGDIGDIFSPISPLSQKRKRTPQQGRIPVLYKGGVVFHHLLGPVRHNRGTTFYSPSRSTNTPTSGVYQFDVDNDCVRRYTSAAEAARVSGLDVKYIRDVCNSEDSHEWEWKSNVDIGFYILDELHNHCECSICNCEDYSEDGDYGVCYFSSEKEKWGELGFDEKEDTTSASASYCNDCEEEMVVHDTRLSDQLRDAGFEPEIGLRTITFKITEYEEMKKLM